MAKLWEKNYTLNSVIEEFTVGEDYLFDTYLVVADCFASLAHATMLTSIGILTKDELSLLKKGISEILESYTKGTFVIKRSDEDCHTAIENYLVEKYSGLGKKIHTGRSRNDQVLAALRLYSRDFIHIFETSCLELVELLFGFAEKYKTVAMPGRTHMQKAMPSSVGLWAASFAEQLIDDLELVETGYKLNNRSPLGSAAGYGVPLELDRELVANLLGFDGPQNNVIAVQSSRGKLESIILDTVEQVVITLSKIAQDLIIFTMPEFGYFSLPDQLTTGSSIMPQKKNPDALELLRAKSSTLSSYVGSIKNIIRTLPSGYNRDFQETKVPFLKGMTLGLQCVEIIKLTFKELKVNKKELYDGFTPEIYATDAALDLVAKGMPFRDAYKEIGSNIDKLKKLNPDDTIYSKKYPGSTGNLNSGPSLQRVHDMKQIIEKREEKLNRVKKDLLGSDASLFYLVKQ